MPFSRKRTIRLNFKLQLLRLLFRLAILVIDARKSVYLSIIYWLIIGESEEELEGGVETTCD